MDCTPLQKEFTTEGVKSMEAMNTAMQSVVTFAGTILTTVTGNEVLAFILAGSLVGVGITVIRQIISVARG